MKNKSQNNSENIVNNRAQRPSSLDDWWKGLGPNSKMFVHALTHMVEGMGSDQQMGVGKRRDFIEVGWLDAPKKFEMMPLIAFQGSVTRPDGIGGRRG